MESYKSVNDSVIARYNCNDFEGIYALGNEWFRINIDKDYCINRFKENRAVTGKILSTRLTDDLGMVKHFEWIGENRNLNFELRVEDGRLKLFDISNFVRQTTDPIRPVQTDNPLKTHLDSIVQKYAFIYMSDTRSVGLSIGVYKDGKKQIYHYGEARKDSGILPNDSSIYQIGSVAKTFVGTLLAKAIIDKKMSLRDDIRKYLKGNYPNLQYNGHAIQLKDLANHTGGFNQFNLIDFPKDFDKWDAHKQNEFFYAYPTSNYIQNWHQLKLDTIPGTNYYYSLGGIMLIRMALENVYGKPLDELVRGYFGNTFQMHDTKLNLANTEIANLAAPHSQGGEPMEPMLRSTESIFTIKSTPADMLKYVEANVREEELAILLSHKPTYGDVRWFSLGLTWMITDTWDKGLRIFHSGHDAGYNTLCAVYPQSDLGFVFMSNEDGRQGYLFNLEKKIFQNIENR
ncbi:serine hydrolase domain-containing protein [Parapedobacter tibetensis]|uniref:serine hydrolase domain-containing protein n=1 Tax=Parapedobacter tibetensis TaxID=2972951 RepID=UPI00214DC2DF|nr:serine hydrolase domain-containing protein [Parapedobacter tibetensis]